jgi:hypothetical protein
LGVLVLMVSVDGLCQTLHFAFIFQWFTLLPMLGFLLDPAYGDAC